MTYKTESSEPRTFGDLRNSRWAEPPYRGRTVREEIRANLLVRLECGTPLFSGIVGYEDTILPQIVNALRIDPAWLPPTHDSPRTTTTCTSATAYRRSSGS